MAKPNGKPEINLLSLTRFHVYPAPNHRRIGWRVVALLSRRRLTDEPITVNRTWKTLRGLKFVRPTKQTNKQTNPLVGRDVAPA